MGFSKDDVERLSRALGEPGWLLERRLEAWGYVEKLDLPREKDEPWRYTDLRRLRFRLDDSPPRSRGPRTATSC
jgi:Fe-S cluster assembly protein SufD